MKKFFLKSPIFIVILVFMSFFATSEIVLGTTESSDSMITSPPTQSNSNSKSNETEERENSVYSSSNFTHQTSDQKSTNIVSPYTSTINNHENVPDSIQVISTDSQNLYGIISDKAKFFQHNLETATLTELTSIEQNLPSLIKIKTSAKTTDGSFFGVDLQGNIQYVSDEDINIVGNYEEIDIYGTLTSNMYALHSELPYESNSTSVSTNSLLNKTFFISEKFTDRDGEMYYLLSTNKSASLGYVSCDAIQLSESSSGILQPAEGYITDIKPNSKLWQDKNFTNFTSIGEFAGKTLKVEGKYHSFQGITYHSVYSSHGTWLGYIEESSGELTADEQGAASQFNKYVSITQNYYTIWGSFSWTNSFSSKQLYQKTFLAKEKYEHSNGFTYYSLYDNRNNLIGYINSLGASIAKTPGGFWYEQNLYGNRQNITYTLWENFDFSVSKGDSSLLNNKTIKISGKYSHYNGNIYYSLYDNSGKWLGYMNAAGLKVTNTPQGNYFDLNKYVTVMKSYYNTWSNFNFDKKLDGSSVYQRTYKAKGVYYHFNGHKYYSLFDNNNNWKGYINSNSSYTINSPGGFWLQENLVRRIVKKDYTIWKDTAITVKSGNTNQHIGKNYHVTGKYRHFNGHLYYSLYSNGKWIGYVNATATGTPHTVYSVNSISKYVWINNGSGNFFSQADPSSSKRGAKSAYKGYMARAAKQANTSSGTYYYLVMPGFDLGWIKASETSAVSEFWRHTTGGRYPSLNVPNLKIRVSVGKQRVTLLSGNKEIYTMLCSTGTYGNDTPYGNFAIQREKGLWFWSAKNGGAAYYRSFLGHGVYLFHSITITGPGAINSFSARQGEKLGTRASHGCIRLSVADAIWFYNNIPYGTPVSVVR